MYRVEYETSSHDINGDDGVLVSRVVEASALARWPPSPRRPRYAGAGASPAPPLPAPGVSGAGSAACAACAAYWYVLALQPWFCTDLLKSLF